MASGGLNPVENTDLTQTDPVWEIPAPVAKEHDWAEMIGSNFSILEREMHDR